MGNSTFLEGPFGTGKTTRAVSQLEALNASNGRTLVLIPQRNVASPYYEEKTTKNLDNIEIATLAGLARRSIELFWPDFYHRFGFEKKISPTFLTHETSQYYMAKTIRPYMAEGMFDSITISRNRIFSQLIDNLNKAALNGYSHQSILKRLNLSSVGNVGQQILFEDVQGSITKFRSFCLKNNLVDFSLQVEILISEFHRKGSLIQDYLSSSYSHLVYDNSEEDAFVVHEFVKKWLESLASTLIIFDEDAGFREFLGASPSSAYSLKENCTNHEKLGSGDVYSQDLIDLATAFDNAISQKKISPSPKTKNRFSEKLEVLDNTFFPEMIESTVNKIDFLINTNEVLPEQIVVLAPYLPDSLRFSLSSRLESKGIRWISNRPSRSIYDEPLNQALITLCSLAHSQWQIVPNADEVAHMLFLFLEPVDIIRAQLLAENAYKSTGDGFRFLSFDDLTQEMKGRITPEIGNLFEILITWIRDYEDNPIEELDIFISKIFGEILAQRNYRFSSNPETARIVDNFIESAKKFRLAVSGAGDVSDVNVSYEFISTVRDKIIQAQYVRFDQNSDTGSIMLSTAHSFLNLNKPVEYQFWLDVGSTAWQTRIFQPLTHPYILSREWDLERYWTDEDEYLRSREHLRKIVLGLIRRTNKKVFLVNSQLGESGYESQGLLWEALNQIKMEEM